MQTWFISDLHLDASRPNGIKIAQRFLSESVNKDDTLYILGDFFEYWLGDDDPAPALQPVLACISQLSNAGVTINVMHGNRDFLLGDQFANQYGCHLIKSDELIIDLYGVPTLIMHGDTLCTDDEDYIKFRQLVRNPAWQHELLSKSLNERTELVKGLRKMSQEAMSGKNSDIIDANQLAIEKTMRQHTVKQLIHGHTHRPAKHTFDLNGSKATRWVLGEWLNSAKILNCTAKETRLITFS